MPEIIQEICLSGFDPDGEPVLRVMDNGTLWLVFSFFPPSLAYEEQHDPFEDEDFDKQLAQAIGVPVIWDDREVFLIQRPKADTIERIRAFIEGYRRKQ